MSKTALFFPGQASQYVGMGKDLFDESADVRRLYELASDELGENLATLSFEGPAEKLKRTRFTQPAILVHSLAVLTLLGDSLPQFEFAAGHSLGEYGALAVCGAFSFEHAIGAVVRRASLMEIACVDNPGTMAAIMGLDIGSVQQLCRQAATKGVVVPANLNSPVQVVVSGSIPGVEEAVRLAKEAGAKRAVMLEVGGAFHSPLMESARSGMKEYLADLTIEDPERPVVTNVTAREARDANSVSELLVQQITSPVRWAETMEYLMEKEVTRVIEIGPGKVLSGLAKRQMRPDKIVNLDTLADVSALAAHAM